MVLLSMFNKDGEGSTAFLKVDDLDIIISSLIHYSRDLSICGNETKGFECFDLGEKISNFKEKTIDEFGGVF